MRQGKLIRRALGVGTALAFLQTACAEQKTSGAIMLSFSTDLSVPKDVTMVGLYITQSGNVLHLFDYPVQDQGNGQFIVRFPSTFAIVSQGKASGPVRTQIVAYRSLPNGQREPLVLKETITTVPTDRTALLRMPLLWMNRGSIANKGLGLQSLAPLQFGPSTLPLSACPQGQSLVDGECGPIEIAERDLPTYDDKDVFGGGESSGKGGVCFDVQTCFANTYPVDVVERDGGCWVRGTVKEVNRLNLALQTTDGAGVCVAQSGGPCLAVLDGRPEDTADPFASHWRVEGGNVRLPRGVCKQLREGGASRLLASSSCNFKTAGLPICGPWTVPLSKSDPAPGGDTGNPIQNGEPTDAGADALAPDGGEPTDAGADALAPDARAGIDSGLDAGAARIENLGGGEPSPQYLALLGNKLYVACANGRVVSMDKNDVNGALGSTQVIRLGTSAEAFGWHLAAQRANGSDVVMHIGRGSPMAPFTGEARAFVINGVTLSTFPSSVMANLTPAWSTQLDGQYGNVAATPFGFFFGGPIRETSSLRGANQLWRMKLPNIGSTDIVDTPFSNNIQLDSFHSVASDPATGAVYFGGQRLGVKSIFRCASTECAGNTFIPSQVGGNKLNDIDPAGAVGRIAANGMDVFYSVVSTASTLRQIWRTLAAGGTPVPMTPPNVDFADLIADEQLNDLAVDANFLYFTTRTGVQAIRLTGAQANEILQLAPFQDRPRALAQDKDYLYFTDMGPGTGVSMGRVRRILKPAVVP